jgi:hypothetical protein
VRRYYIAKPSGVSVELIKVGFAGDIVEGISLLDKYKFQDSRSSHDVSHLPPSTRV